MRIRACRGISLVEFTVALIVTAVGAIYAAPMYYMIVNNHRATAYTNELVAALNYARTQAVTRGYPVSVCSSDDAAHCTDTPWATGYIVFSDAGRPGAVDAQDNVLRHRSAREPRITVTLSGAPYVRFRPSGGVLVRHSGDQAPSTSVAQSGVGYWLDRLSPLPAAHAETMPMRAVSMSLTGVFTVCVGRAGRVVKLSPQGSITTSVMDCR